MHEFGAAPASTATDLQVTQDEDVVKLQVRQVVWQGWQLSGVPPKPFVHLQEFGAAPASIVFALHELHPLALALTQVAHAVEHGKQFAAVVLG